MIDIVPTHQCRRSTLPDRKSNYTLKCTRINPTKVASHSFHESEERSIHTIHEMRSIQKRAPQKGKDNNELGSAEQLAENSFTQISSDESS